MRIGQVAKLSGLSTRTIDYYTSNKLLPVTRSDSNYRLYSEDVLYTLERIKLLKKQRMSIGEIRNVIHSMEDQEIEPIMDEVQDEIACLHKKLASLEERLKDAPQEEKKKVYRTLETKLLDVMKLLSLM
ncbi:MULTISPECIES: MerR family transcriptional regulator [Niallia]|uniref:MerR family transcriptional regulator n=1 Tax=Niallia circulans TaxID=1397 RepID=A0A268FF13_NIACI|nr:MerR family transcriptional regulator [Niallia circulans]AYV68403.1 MerR family DNA-binding transcriptional regulator [Niallia circulans]AYV73197.1 MerR family DNA-binding transcriptional regulator [Niallia circulans]NRG26661.1 MerR family transcriptional regulator [Niallia circulans]PAD83960.1 MerR family transcriptional regulator [Niallia circulans]QJX64316.1 MerR family transcriptional regulator [Niallia circulans]